MGLLDIVINYIPNSPIKAASTQSSGSGDMRKTAHSSSRAMKFASDVAQKALNLMAIVRPVTVVSILAKEVTMFLGAQHVTHFPHSTLQQVQVRGGGLVVWLNVLHHVNYTRVLACNYFLILNCIVYTVINFISVIILFFFQVTVTM